MTPLQEIAKLYDGYDTSDLNQLDHQILKILQKEKLIEFLEIESDWGDWTEVRYQGFEKTP